MVDQFSGLMHEDEVLPEQKFALYLQQTEEGCDYTIGCGQRLVDLDSKTLQGAETEAARYICENFSGDRETTIKRAFVFAYWKELDVESVYREIDTVKRRDEAEQKDLRERAEYERLKIKYEGK